MDSYAELAAENPTPWKLVALIWSVIAIGVALLVWGILLLDGRPNEQANGISPQRDERIVLHGRRLLSDMVFVAEDTETGCEFAVSSNGGMALIPGTCEKEMP